MKILSATSPQWANAEHTAVNLTITTDTLGDLPFTASPDDTEAHGQQLYTDAVAGTFGIIAEFVGPTLAEHKAAAVATVIANRDTKRYTNVTALGHTWQADQTSKDLLSDAINLAQAGLPLPTEWRDADNTNMTITSITDLLAIAGAMATQTQAAYAWSWGKKGAIETATTAAELAAIDLTN